VLFRSKPASLSLIGIIESAITLCPIRVPRTGSIRHWIVCGRFFTDPENRRHNLASPRKAFAWLGKKRRILFRCRLIWINFEKVIVSVWFARFLAQLRQAPRDSSRGVMGKQSGDGGENERYCVSKTSSFHWSMPCKRTNEMA